ncbi:hypothetical protein NE237_019405 [Protea cynaroides]|uniref:Uncharacterized protein n=1 Tax=Protea cynaroides TaxID=273540 RepID=A0A9Q0KBQ9_9MAGN|nr:hypothetical protein NE237_019405 [Protea cynaroides]
MASMWASQRGKCHFVIMGMDDLSMARSGKKRRLNPDSSESTPYSPCKEEILGDAKRDLVRDADYKVLLKFLNMDVESESEEDDIDSDYKAFLDNLKADENSYIYEMKNEDGKSISFKYERWDESLHETDRERNPELNISSQEKRGSVMEEEIESESSTSEDYCPLSSEHKNDMEYSEVDESYELFLSKLSQNGESMILEYDEDVERDVQYCSRQKFQRSPSPNPLNLSMDEDECSCIEVLEGDCNFSQYRERLMVLLRMPYSEQDYRDLKYLAQTKKPMEKDRELRGRWASYPTDKSRLSYCDHYHDFKQVFESAPHHRSIRFNLLRGFFYYLKNLSHEGLFKPWRDSECLKIKPGSK